MLWNDLQLAMFDPVLSGFLGIAHHSRIHFTHFWCQLWSCAVHCILVIFSLDMCASSIDTIHSQFQPFYDSKYYKELMHMHWNVGGICAVMRGGSREVHSAKANIILGGTTLPRTGQNRRSSRTRMHFCYYSLVSIFPCRDFKSSFCFCDSNETFKGKEPG